MKDPDETQKRLAAENAELRTRLEKAQTETAQACGALAESEARFHAVIESLPFDFFMLGLDGRYALFNSVGPIRYENVVGKRPTDLDVDPETLAVWEANNQRAYAGETIKEETSYVLRGQLRHFYNVITPIRDGEQILGILGVNIDITERKRLEEEHERARRLESLGLLAGGLAHDFNNILTGVLGNLSVLAAEGRIEKSDLHLVQKAEKACHRARALTGQLLTFAKGGQPVLQSLDLAALVRETCDFALRDATCRCEITFAPDLHPAMVDPDQLAQVIHNLVLNAAQAMTDGGDVLVSADNVEAESEPELDLNGDRHVLLTVADTGKGMTEDQVQRIFDPFYTTRPDGHGLGLAIVASIVERHRGRILIDSQPGDGTRVRLYLQAADTAPAVGEASAAEPHKGSGRILVMDDDHSVCDTFGKMLEVIGYQPTLTHTCAEALDAFRQALMKDEPFDAVILDLTVADGPGGRVAVKELAKISPEVRAIVTSGYSNDPVLADHRSFGFVGVLTKPCGLQDLTAALSQVLPSED